MTEFDDQSGASRSDQPTMEKAPVHIDRKGRLSVDPGDLVASKAFRDQLDAMVELAKTHPPRTASRR